MAVSLVIRYRDADDMVAPPPEQELLEFKAAVFGILVRTASATDRLVYYSADYNEDGEAARALEGS
jgi:hypothetical protein